MAFLSQVVFEAGDSVDLQQLSNQITDVLSLTNGKCNTMNSLRVSWDGCDTSQIESETLTTAIDSWVQSSEVEESVGDCGSFESMNFVTSGGSFEKLLYPGSSVVIQGPEKTTDTFVSFRTVHLLPVPSLNLVLMQELMTIRNGFITSQSDKPTYSEVADKTVVLSNDFLNKWLTKFQLDTDYEVIAAQDIVNAE